MVSKNNRYLKDVLQADKTQHWSLRKLGIGVTSVLLGTTFYLGGNTVAHADQTAPVAPSDNGGQVATANPVASGNTAVLRSQPQAAAQTQSSAQPQAATNTSTASTSASASIAPVTSAPTSTVAQSAAPTSAVQSSANSSAVVNGGVANNGAAVTSDAAQSELTTTLNVNSEAVASQSPAVFAQSLAEGDQNQAQTYWADTSSASLIPQHDQDDQFQNGNNSYRAPFNDFFRFGISGSFTINSSKLQPGNTINIVQLRTTSSTGKFMFFYPATGNDILTYQGQQIGSIDVDNGIVQLKVTNKINTVGDVTFNFATYDRKLVFNYQTDLNNFKPLGSGEYPYWETVDLVNNKDEVLNTYKFELGYGQYVPLNYYNGGLAPFPQHNNGELQDFNTNTIINGLQEFNDLQNSNGKSANVNLKDTYKCHYKLTVNTKNGQHVSANDQNYGFSLSNAYVRPMIFSIENGKMLGYKSNPTQPYAVQTDPRDIPLTKLNNGLSLSQIDSTNFTGAAYSLQDDGSYLVVYHMPASLLKLNDSDFNKTAAIFQNIALSSDPDKALANMESFYNDGVLKGMPVEFMLALNLDYNNPDSGSNIVMQRLDQQGQLIYQATMSSLPNRVSLKDQAELNVHYINIDTGESMNVPADTEKTIYADPETKPTVSVKVPSISHYHLVSVNGNVAQLGNGNTITKTANDTFVNANDVANGETTINLPGKRGEIGDAYVFYQGDDEQGEVRFVDADTPDATGPNGYKLLDAKPTNPGHYGNAFTFPAGQDPQTILNNFEAAHYQYDASKQGPNAYVFTDTHTYKDNSNNNQQNIYYVYLHHATTTVNKVVKRTIHYIKNDGTPMAGLSDNVQNVTFTGKHDQVTGEDKWKDSNKTFDAVASPTVEGYQASPQTVGKVTGITPTTPDINETVVYTPIVALTVNYIDDVTNSTLQSDSFSGEEGDDAHYNTKNAISNYTSRGYRVVSDSTNGAPLKYDGKTYTVHFTHATTPVNKTVKRTIHHVKNDGTPMEGLSDKVQEVTFTGNHDQVTGVDNWDGNSNNFFSAVASPVVTGYQASPQTVAEVDGITPITLDDVETVVYTPVKPVVNIKDLTVNYVDDTTNSTLQSDRFSGDEGADANYNTKGTITNYTNQGYRLVSDPTNGEPLKYDGNTYTVHFAHTLVPVDPNHPQPKYHYGKEDLQRTASRTINYINADGKLFSTKTDAMHFVGTGTLDEVTHQLVTVDGNGQITGPGQLTWVPDKESLPAVTSPTVENEHVALITPANQADGTNVKGVTFNYNSGDLMIDVYYVKDNMVAKNAKTVNIKQTVHFVNNAGETVLPDNVQTITFTRTPDVTNTTTNTTVPGAWDKDSDTYQDVVVPTLNGYVTKIKLVKGTTVTHDGHDSVITVVYQPTGKLIPIDQHGNPIKGAPTPQYPTDPSDPTKVVPDEPIPNVPGYRPADDQSTTVTPGDPTQNTDVRYTNQQAAIVNYVDANTGERLATSGLIYGDADTVINYSTDGVLATLGTRGYKVISDDFDTATPQKFDHDIYTQQQYTILLSNQNNSQGSNSQGSNSQGSQGSNSQGSNSQSSQGSNSQGSNSQGSQGSNSQGSNSQGSQGSNSQGSNSQGSQGSNSQGSNSQGSQGSNSQGSNSQGSQGSNSQGSNSQGSQGSNSQGSQGSNSQGSNSQNSQGSNSQGSNSQGSQGSNSQGSNSQGSNSQGSNSQSSQGSNSQGSQGSNSQGSNSQGSNSQSGQGSNSQGSNSQGSQGSNSQGSNSQGSQGSNSQGSNSQGSQGSNSQGSNSQGSQGSNSQGSNSQGSQGSNSQGSNSQGSQGSNSQGSNSQGSNSQGSQGSNSQGSNSQGSQGSNSQGSNSQGSQGSNSQGSNSQSSQGSNSQGSNSQGSQGSNSQGSNSQGSNSQSSQGSNSQGSQSSNSQGSNSQGMSSQNSQNPNFPGNQDSNQTPQGNPIPNVVTYANQGNGGQTISNGGLNGVATQPGVLNTTAYTGAIAGNDTQAAGNEVANTALPQTGNDEAQKAIALGGLSALATLGLLGVAKKRHE